MDINKIFGLFGKNNPDRNYPEPTEEEVEGMLGFEEFRTTPTYQIKMFQKIIINHLNFQKRLVKMFQNSDPELGDFTDLEEAGEHMAFFRGWSFIEDVDLELEVWQDCLKIQDSELLGEALKMSIKFFESIEEYEKCALLTKIQKFLKNNLDS
tara:strand:- start:771 stop:1229 length:459 start_codon:yes stop_codon:yes gene_type:complete